MLYYINIYSSMLSWILPNLYTVQYIYLEFEMIGHRYTNHFFVCPLY